MVTEFLLDTDIVVFALRRAGMVLRDRLDSERGRIHLSTVTVTELEYGAMRSADPDRERTMIHEALALTKVLDFDRTAAEDAGHLRAELAAAGTPIGGYDVLIAGHARSLGLTLVTHNVREFGRVTGLDVVDWTEG